MGWNLNKNSRVRGLGFEIKFQCELNSDSFHEFGPGLEKLISQLGYCLNLNWVQISFASNPIRICKIAAHVLYISGWIQVNLPHYTYE